MARWTREQLGRVGHQTLYNLAIEMLEHIEALEALLETAKRGHVAALEMQTQLKRELAVLQEELGISDEEMALRIATNAN